MSLEKKKHYSRFYASLAVFLAAGTLTLGNTAFAKVDMDLTEMSIEALMDIEVTSVSKKAQKLSESAAAIFAMTSEDIRRSGVTNIADALRMVPGLHVGRIDSSKWAVSSRGFNGRFANKLLVLIDGRSVYTPSFSGVYWEVQDTLLEDVERIEVIRGPGAALWGANAVNGVINIITKKAADTQGGLLTMGAGDKEQIFGGLRYGAALGEKSHARLYVKGFERDSFQYEDGSDSGDEWDTLRSGFRLDSHLSDRDEFTLQGDIYQSNIDQTLYLATLSPPSYSQTIRDEADLSGGNLLGRWQRTFSSKSQISLQLYYDRTDHGEGYYSEQRDTYDIDLQHRFALGERHDILWGLGYRYSRDDFSNSSILTIEPDNRDDEIFSGFIQDEIMLVNDRLWLTLGSKFEQNDYSDFEMQPSARLLWTPHPEHTLWAAVSRAVRTPSRAEHDATLLNTVIPPAPPFNPLPVALTIVGGPDYDSEELLAWELGYRMAPGPDLSLDFAFFYNDYDELRSYEQEAPIFMGTYLEQPLRFDNRFKAETCGIELAAMYQAADWWRLDLAYSYLNMDIDTNHNDNQYGEEARHQVSLRSAINLGNVDLDLWLRYVDDVKSVNSRTPETGRWEIDDYVTLDVRLAWQVKNNLELALVGRNLLDDAHPEYIQENFINPTEIERSLHGKITYQF